MDNSNWQDDDGGHLQPLALEVSVITKSKKGREKYLELMDTGDSEG